MPTGEQVVAASQLKIGGSLRIKRDIDASKANTPHLTAIDARQASRHITSNDAKQKRRQREGLAQRGEVADGEGAKLVDVTARDNGRAGEQGLRGKNVHRET